MIRNEELKQRCYPYIDWVIDIQTSNSTSKVLKTDKQIWTIQFFSTLYNQKQNEKDFTGNEDFSVLLCNDDWHFLNISKYM